MKRVFISLYLLLSVCLIGMTWTFEQLWQAQVAAKPDSQDIPLVLMAQMLRHQPQMQRAHTINQLQRQTDYPLALLPLEAVSLPLTEQLSANQVLRSTNQQHQEFLFIQVDQQVLVLGPFSTSQQTLWQAIYTLVFFLLLALALLLWSWPLIRDLKKLQQATKDFGDGQWQQQLRLSTRSQVAPLGHTFNRMAKQIHLLIDNQRQLTQTVSHEIRTPLARIKFALALLPSYYQNQEKTEDERQAFMQEIRGDIDEIDKLLAEMLTYASLEAGNAEPQLELCDLYAITQKVIQRLMPLSSHRIELQSSIKHCPLQAEPLLVERALQNLLTNAQRYAKSQIHVEIKLNQDQYQLTVTDDGEGIAPDEQPNIFAPYYRGRQTQTGVQAHEKSGYGLGLAIVSRIMKRANGQLTLNSEPGCTQFHLCWPKQHHKQLI